MRTRSSNTGPLPVAPLCRSSDPRPPTLVADPPGHPEYEKLEERLRLKPNSFLLVIQLAMPDGRGWIETRQLPFKAPRSIDAYIEGSS